MRGEVTIDRVQVVEREALAALGEDGSRLVVDLAECKFLCSAGLGFLVKVSKVAHERGGAVALARAMPPLMRLLRAVGLEEVLPHFATLDAASAFVARAPAPPGPGGR
jgi:anti-anti-sigma factor